MSDKKLLEEKVVRRFMKLANIEQLSEGFVKDNSKVLKENMQQMPQMNQVEEADKLVGDDSMGGGMEPDGDEGGAGNEELFKKIAQAIADAMGVQASIEGAGSDGSGDMGDLEMSDEEGSEGGEEKGEEEESDEGGEEESGEEDEQELDESSEEELNEASEEELDESSEEELDEKKDKEEDEEEEEEEGEMQEQIAEAVLKRVKARLLAEAKASKEKAVKEGGMKKPMSAMKKKVQAKKGKKMEEASKGGHSTGKASSVNWGLKGGKDVGNKTKSSAKKGNLTPAKKSSKHTK